LLAYYQQILVEKNIEKSNTVVYILLQVLLFAFVVHVQKFKLS